MAPKGPYKFTKIPRKAALASYAKYGNKSAAAAAGGVKLVCLNRTIQNDPEFKDDFEEARLQFIAVLEAEALRRGVEGWDEREGVRKYDTHLLQKLLGRHDPANWRERVSVDQTISGKLDLGLDLDKLPPESLDALEEIIERGSKEE